ncbi:MAG: SoxR reducing system RseC family protein [Chromatiaceae bacterium]|nr:SoxR reducing system RseC family protein [Chromatiaceae bacterium]MCP5312059.1 SoxR reducing system RseC family protein [Chromatiaceae bacterium]
MIEEQAQVVGVDGAYAEIATERRSACGTCAAQSGCGTSVLAAWFPQRRLTFRVRNGIDAKVGDRVIVGLDEGALQRGALWLYLVPLAGLLVGAIAGDRLFLHLSWSSELGAVAIGLLGLSVGLAISRRLTLADVATGRCGVQLLRIAGRSPTIPITKVFRKVE